MIKLNALISEVNLFSKEDLQSSIEKILKFKDVSKKEIINYFNTQYIKWFVSANEDSEKSQFVKSHHQVAGEPDWAKNTFDFVHFSDEHKNKLYHTIDFLDTLNDNDLKKIHKIPFSQMVQLVKKWDEKLAKNMHSNRIKFFKIGVDVEILQDFGDGFKMVKLLSADSKDEEGNLMGHCVGENQYEHKLIYSLRDKNNLPHATLQLNDSGNKIIQIKGKQNIAPISKYVPYIVQFIRKNKLQVIGDHENIGFVEWNDIIYDPESKEWKYLYKRTVIPYLADTLLKIKQNIRDGIYTGIIVIDGLFLKKLPRFLRGIRVEGSFHCSKNLLTSLENSPQYVNGNFICRNNQLTSLQGAPQRVRGDFGCTNNQLTSLQGAPQRVGGSFYCSNNPVKFVAKDIRKIVSVLGMVGV